MKFDRKIYFDSVRPSLFFGKLNEGQINGQEAILNGWETYLDSEDTRWLAYMLATTYHETSQEMLPIEEYGKGQGMEYGKPDPETGQTYYGRGFVQLTWRDNYARADMEGGWIDSDSCEWHAENALDPFKAARIMWFGMSEGWFRSDSQGKQTLARYFNDGGEDPYGAREIINGDKSKVPSWSNGVSIGNLIKGYYEKFLKALDAARIEDTPDPEPVPKVTIVVTVPTNVEVSVMVNGMEYGT
jgi:hypothetical protein